MVEEAIESVSVVTDREIQDLPGAEEAAEAGAIHPDHIALTEEGEEDLQEAEGEAILLEEDIPIEVLALQDQGIQEDLEIQEEDQVLNQKAVSERTLLTAEIEEAQVQEDLEIQEVQEDQEIQEVQEEVQLQRDPETPEVQEDQETLEVQEEAQEELQAEAPLRETTLQDTHQKALLMAIRKSDSTKLPTTQVQPSQKTMAL